MRRTVFALLAVSGFLLPATIYGARFKSTLKGIPEISVVVERLDRETPPEGITVDDIRAKAELRLRRNGVNVVNDSRHASLYIRLQCLPVGPTGASACDILVEAFQLVHLKFADRDSGAVTWDVASMLITHSRRDVLDEIENFVDEFSEDYLEVNPVRPTSH